MKSQNHAMQSISIQGASHFKFSAVRPQDLGAAEYTLVTLVVDVSSSVSAYVNELQDAIAAVLDACQRSARADNLLLRMLHFNSQVGEVFGFKTVHDIDPAALPALRPNGSTALYDAAFDAVAASLQYAHILCDQDYMVNAAVYVITDGCDNDSKSADASQIAQRIRQARRQEQVESILTVLIGVNTSDSGVDKALSEFARKAAFDQAIDAGQASAATLMKISGFVSRSISSQSQALGGGAPSQSLSF